MQEVVSSAPAKPSPDVALEPNALAQSYQPRRMHAAILSIVWNLTWVCAFVASGAPRKLLGALPHSTWWSPPAYLSIFFCLFAAVNLPLELWYGYLHERQFGLVKQGIRTWGRDWLIGNLQHGTLFVIGSLLILLAQQRAPSHWIIAISAGMLLIFLLATYFAAELIPPGLFQLDRIAPAEVVRLQTLLGSAQTLPPIVLFTWPEARDFSGGLVGLGRRQMLLISRATLELGSDALLRFVLLHELGHRRYHHLLLSTLAAWGYATAGLVFCDAAIIRLTHLNIPLGSAAYIPWLAMFFTAWMVLGQPVLAYIGRRMEYQADRFYLDHGGNSDEMATALGQLSQRDLARTDTTRRRQSLIEPLPIITRRLRAAQLHLAGRNP